MISRLWEVWKRVQRSRIVLSLALMLVTFVIVLLIAKLFAPSQGLDLVRLTLKQGGEIVVEASPWTVFLVAVWALLLWWLVWPKGNRWEPSEINVEVARIGKIIMKPNQEVAGIAHRAWTEIVTRKAGQTFDEENDVIVEVYDSWYQLFGEFRSLLKSIPADRLRKDEDARTLSDALLRAMNEVLRPHLTRHQARFRAWYTLALEKTPEATPQELQSRYPDFKALIEDLKSVNATFVQFADALEKIARG